MNLRSLYISPTYLCTSSASLYAIRLSRLSRLRSAGCMTPLDSRYMRLDGFERL